SSTAFYQNASEAIRGRPFVVLGESSNEAVWYFDHPHEAIDDLTRPELKTRFFDSPGTLLLISAEFAARVPGLRESLSIEHRLMRGQREYWIASPNGLHPPPVALFVPQKIRGVRYATTKEE